MIVVFDGEDYGMWKERIMMFLRYEEYDTVITRVKTETDNAKWDKNDLKTINIIYSVITNRQLEFINEEQHRMQSTDCVQKEIGEDEA